jgi:hypothetical protein
LSDVATLPQLNCQLSAQPGGKALSELTVGDVFLVNCQGLIAPDLKDPLFFAYKDDKESLRLRVLSVEEKSAASLKLNVASYRAEAHERQKFIISDGTRQYATNELSWTVKSVIKPDSERELLPAMGPFKVGYPIWFWLVLSGALFLFTFFSWKVWRKRRQKKELIESVLQGNLSQVVLTPVQEFYKTYRDLQRAQQRSKPNECLNKLDHAFRLYFLRRFYIPTFDWGTKDIIKDLKRANPRVYKASKSKLYKTFGELERLKGREILASEVEELLVLTLSAVEACESAQRELKK